MLTLCRSKQSGRDAGRLDLSWAAWAVNESLCFQSRQRVWEGFQPRNLYVQSCGNFCGRVLVSEMFWELISVASGVLQNSKNSPRIYTPGVELMKLLRWVNSHHGTSYKHIFQITWLTRWCWHEVIFVTNTTFFSYTQPPLPLLFIVIMYLLSISLLICPRSKYLSKE